jgi:hypothetical protein
LVISWVGDFDFGFQRADRHFRSLAPLSPKHMDDSAPILPMLCFTAQGSDPDQDLPPTGHSERRKVHVFIAILEMNVHAGCIIGPIPAGADDRETG